MIIAIITRMPFSRRPTTCLFEKLYGKCATDFTHPGPDFPIGNIGHWPRGPPVRGGGGTGLSL